MAKCAICGKEITDKEYLRAVNGNKMKFCSSICVKEAWRRICKYAAELKKNRRKKPISPVAPAKEPRQTGRKKKERAEPLTIETRTRILELRAAGMGPSAIAVKIGCTYAQVDYTCKAFVLE